MVEQLPVKELVVGSTPTRGARQFNISVLGFFRKTFEEGLMAYRDNVTALAKKLGVSNDPILREEDITVAQVTFVRNDGSVTNIPATDMNRADRLFFQNLATDDREENGWNGIIERDENLLRAAAEHFAELWEPGPVPGKRKLLDALRDPRCVEIEIFRKN